MDYQKIHNLIINQAKIRNLIAGEYYEKHHIIPKCLGGTNEKSNIVSLTCREHYIVHQLLTKIYPHEIKLIYAAIMMTIDDKNGRNNNRNYEWLRKRFIDNHPCKIEEVRNKISKSLKIYYSDPKFDIIRKEKLEYRECICGCGDQFITKKKSKQTYILGHNDNNGKNIGISLKKYLINLDDEKLKERMKNSTFKCDHIKRGKSISEGKKGKSTNQQEIMGKRYSNMSDVDFNNFLLTMKTGKSNMAKTRASNLRKKYLGRI